MEKIKKEKYVNNIVVFPKFKHDIPPQTVEELKQKIINSRIEMADILAQEITKENVRIMVENGYNVQYTKDIAFLMTTLKSILLRIERIDYPLQNLIDDTVIEEDEEEEIGD